MTDIWTRRNNIEKARREKMNEAMDEYDRTVFYPARKQLIEDCEKIGHSGGKFHNNGFGWTWFYCGKCGGRYDVTGPDGEKR
jgi:hypothetical protein